MTNAEKRLADGCYFDQASADRAINFIEKYVKVSTTGKPIKLLDWQRSYIEECYGWKDAAGNKLVKRSILSTGKKNGKNLILSSILLYELVGGTCPSPFCVSASTARENASMIYRELAFSIRNNPSLNRICKCLDSTKEITCKKKNARYKAFSSDASAA